MLLAFSSVRPYRRIRSMQSSASFTKPCVAVGNCGSDNMENSCSSGAHGPNPLLIFFDEMCSKQRSSADKRAQRIADYVVHLCHTKRIAVLRILNSCAEHTTNKRREDDSAPAMPLLRQRIGKRQSKRKEEEHVHQQLPIELRLLPCRGEGSKGRKNEFIVTGCTGQDGGIKDSGSRHAKNDDIDCQPSLPADVLAEDCPSKNHAQHQDTYRKQAHCIDSLKHLTLPFQSVNRTRQQTSVPALFCQLILRRLAAGGNQIIEW